MAKPTIRFKGYTEDWEQRKLGEATESIKNGYTYKADGSRTHKYKITRIESISSGAINVEKLGSSDEINENYRLVDGDILFSHINSLPYIANTAIYTNDLGEIYHGMNLLNIRVKNKIIDSHFLLHLLKKESTRNWFRIIAKPAVNQASISTTEVALFEFRMPDMEEQKRISSVLDNLDTLITLHQRKCEETKILKKYMLQKMFPQNGQKVPEIRFKGFTEDWKQRKLGEIITEYKETVDSDCTLPILTSSKTEGVILQEEHFGRKQQHDITGYNILPRNYCTYRNRSDGVDFTFNINKCCDKGIISKFYPVFSGKNSDVLFLSLVLNNSDEVVREIAYTCTGTGQKVLSFLDLQKMKVRVPSFDEQKEIAAYFDSLDHLITLHQRKCEELKNIKKFMLQNMFV